MISASPDVVQSGDGVSVSVSACYVNGDINTDYDHSLTLSANFDGGAEYFFYFVDGNQGHQGDSIPLTISWNNGVGGMEGILQFNDYYDGTITLTIWDSGNSSVMGTAYITFRGWL